MSRVTPATASSTAAGGSLPLGRRTYEDFHGFWPA
jgi:hypothetical protein